MIKSIIAFELDEETYAVYTINVEITVPEAFELLGQAMAKAFDEGNTALIDISGYFADLFIVEQKLFKQGSLYNAVLPDWLDLTLLIWIFSKRDMRIYISAEQWKFNVPEKRMRLLDIPHPQPKEGV